MCVTSDDFEALETCSNIGILKNTNVHTLLHVLDAGSHTSQETIMCVTSADFEALRTCSTTDRYSKEYTSTYFTTLVYQIEVFIG